MTTTTVNSDGAGPTKRRSADFHEYWDPDELERLRAEGSAPWVTDRLLEALRTDVRVAAFDAQLAEVDDMGLMVSERHDVEMGLIKLRNARRGQIISSISVDVQVVEPWQIEQAWHICAGAGEMLQALTPEALEDSRRYWREGSRHFGTLVGLSSAMIANELAGCSGFLRAFGLPVPDPRQFVLTRMRMEADTEQAEAEPGSLAALFADTADPKERPKPTVNAVLAGMGLHVPGSTKIVDAGA